MKLNPNKQSPADEDMKSAKNLELQKATQQAKSLTKALGESERVQEMVEECAEELSSVNSDLKQELAEGEALPGVEKALEKSEVIENKVQDASEELALVNRALEDEVKERRLLETQLAAVTEQEEAARHAALHDALTGLPNRGLFSDRLEHGLAQAKRHDWTLAVMFVDLNEFKSINDTHGHDVGDSVLQTIAARLKENTRGDDTVSRYGGDEFLFLLVNTQNQDGVTRIAEKIIKAIQMPFDLPTDNGIIRLSISASIGISIFPKDGSTADTLVKCADKAMYEAKQNKSGVAFSQ